MNCCKVTDLRNKEVINSQSGCRLGCVDDVEIDTSCAKLVSIIIYGKPRLFGLLGRCEDIIIKWADIKLIGEDTILVCNCPSTRRRSSKGAFFPFLRI